MSLTRDICGFTASICPGAGMACGSVPSRVTTAQARGHRGAGILDHMNVARGTQHWQHLGSGGGSRGGNVETEAGRGRGCGWRESPTVIWGELQEENLLPGTWRKRKCSLVRLYSVTGYVQEDCVYKCAVDIDSLWIDRPTGRLY